MPPSDLLVEIERYYDAVPRARSSVEEIGPFTLFVATSGWPYYARPRLDSTWTSAEPAPATASDVQAVFARQRDLGAPQALEWVDETTPGLVDVVIAAGAAVARCPLLVLDGEPAGTAGTARMIEADDCTDIAVAQAAIAVSFASTGTSIGTVGLLERDAHLRSAATADLEALRERLRTGSIRMAVACAPDAHDAGPVGGGSHIPVGTVTEIVGVGVLPAYRRRGLGGHLTYSLAEDALKLGVTTVFCSAQADDVARVYESVGFGRVGTACIASAESSR